MRTRAGLIIAVAAAGLAMPADGAVRDVPHVGFADLRSQRLEGQTAVLRRGANGWGRLSVVVTVGIDGRVIDARAADYNFDKLDPEPGLAAVRTWRFRPQRFEGRPVIAVGTVDIAYQPPEDAWDASVPFPDSAPADTEITLERDPCLGNCPYYRVTVSGDGTVRFRAGGDNPAEPADEARPAFDRDNVLLPGTHVAHVDPAAVALLIAKFRDAHFFGLKPEYRALITDQPTYILTVRAGGRSKQIVDYAGRAVGMPAAINALEDAVDAVSGSERWVNGNSGTIALLEAERFDFRSQAAAELVAAATETFRLPDRDHWSEPLVLALLDRGAPLDAMVEAVLARDMTGENVDPPAKASLGSVLAYRAAVAGDETLFQRMARKGYLARLPQERLSEAFASGAGCSPAIARVLVKAGAKPATVTQWGTALINSQATWVCKSETRQLKTARALIDLGVPVDEQGEWRGTALMGRNSPELTRLLLARGANPNAHTKEGATPLLEAYDDRVALILLRAGADPRARDRDGSVREHAIARHMPATLVWLDAHEIK